MRDQRGALTGGAKGGWAFMANDEENSIGLEIVVMETKVFGAAVEVSLGRNGEGGREREGRRGR